jgi:23S rRNA pseudouridine1911/1915/1917 synthase
MALTQPHQQAFGGGDQKPVFLLKSGDFTIPVIYCDDDFMIVSKPAGLVVYQPGGGSGPSLASAVKKHVVADKSERAGIVHRLDKDTSGVMVVARTTSSHDYFAKLFASRKVSKHYLALVHGRLKQPRARLELPIKRSLKYPTQMSIHPAGRSAITEYQVTKEFVLYSLVDVNIMTGRTHQIRVQFAHLGHPVVGDSVYGKRNRPAGLNRQFLHAKRLGFVSPSGESVSYEVALPIELSTFLEGLA